MTAAHTPDWDSIKKQIKKAIEKNSSQSKAKHHPLQWEEIERHLRKKHQHSRKKTSKRSPISHHHPQDESHHQTTKWSSVRNEIDTVFAKPPDRYGQSMKDPSPHVSAQPHDSSDKTVSDDSSPSSSDKKDLSMGSKKEKHVQKRDDTNHRMGWGWVTQRKKQIRTEPVQPYTSTYLKKRDTSSFPFQKKSKRKTVTPFPKFKKLREYINRIPVTVTFEKFRRMQPKQMIYENIVEIILFAIGMVFLLSLTPGNMKIGLTFLLIASFLFFLMIEEKKDRESTDLPISYLPRRNTSTASSFYMRTKKAASQQKHRSLSLSSVKMSILSPVTMLSQRVKQIQLSLHDRITVILISWTLLLFVITADIEIFFILIFIGILITKEMTDMYTTKGFKLRLNAYIVVFLCVYVILISQKVISILQS